MRRSVRRNPSARLIAIISSTAAVAVCSAVFTESSDAKGTDRGRRIQAALAMYDTDHRALPNIEFEPVSTPPVLEFPDSGIGAGLADIEFHGPPVGQPTRLPDPGETLERSIPVEVSGLLLFGPGSEPFTGNSFFDITYRIANNSSAMFGPFDTELLSLELRALHPTLGEIVLRESPTLASLGQHTVEPVPGTTSDFHVDSFFDVFFELSVGGGPFVPAVGPLQMYLTSVPEPGTMALAMLGAAGFAMIARRRRYDAGD